MGNQPIPIPKFSRLGRVEIRGEKNAKAKYPAAFKGFEPVNNVTHNILYASLYSLSFCFFLTFFYLESIFFSAQSPQKRYCTLQKKEAVLIGNAHLTTIKLQPLIRVDFFDQVSDTILWN